MSARITAGMLCLIRGSETEYDGRVVTTQRHVGICCAYVGTKLCWVLDAWQIAVPWDADPWAISSQYLVPITDPDIDTTETSDALHDSLVAVLAEARP